MTLLYIMYLVFSEITSPIFDRYYSLFCNQVSLPIPVQILIATMGKIFTKSVVC